MAVVVPLLSMYAAGTAAAAVAAGAAMTLGGALTIAGGFFSAVGLLDKNKDAAKLGGVLSLFGGVANAFQGGGATAGAEGAAQSTAPTGSADVAKALTEGGEGTGSLLTNPGAASSVPDLGSAGAGVGADFMTGIASGGEVAAPMGGGLGTGAASSNSIAETLTGMKGGGTGLVGGSAQPTQSLLERAAATMTQADVANAAKSTQVSSGGLFDQAMGKVGGYVDAAGKWVQKNPMAANMIFNTLEGMYGPQAEAIDYQKALMERARRNLNSPIRLTYTPTGG